MRKSRRSFDLLNLIALDEKFRRIRLRNVRMNYTLNYEWEQLDHEIWVRKLEI